MGDFPCILTIAGSDSGGGAGIQADLKTIAMLRGYGASVITALTAQNTRTVTGIHAPSAKFVAQQLRTRARRHSGGRGQDRDAVFRADHEGDRAAPEQARVSPGGRPGLRCHVGGEAAQG